MKELNVKAVIGNVRLVLKSRDIDKLNNPTYEFIIGYMSFIAHYSLAGFRDEYRDLRKFVEALQTSEYSNDIDHNLNWANELESRERNNERGDKGIDKAEAIRGIVAVCREYQDAINKELDEKEEALNKEVGRRLLSGEMTLRDIVG